MEIVQVTAKTRPVKRSQGQSAVCGAAYRAGEKLLDERQDKVADYSRRSPDVWHSEILAPEHTPDSLRDRQTLWNAAEAAERRSDGRPARDVTLGLPWGMSQAEHEEAVRSFAEKEFVAKGHIVDMAFHRYGSRVSDVSDEGRETLRRWAERNVPFYERSECEGLHDPHVKIERNRDGDVTGYKIFQPHAHLFVTPRAVEEDGFAAKRNRDFDRHDQAKEWRYGWGHHLNGYLERGEYDFRVSALAPKTDLDLPLKPQDMPLESYHIEQRGEESVVREERDFNSVHNDALRSAARSDTSQDEDAEHYSRLERLRSWWSNMRSSFSDWKDHFKDRAAGLFRSNEPAESVEPEPAPEPSATAPPQPEPDSSTQGEAHEHGP